MDEQESSLQFVEHDRLSKFLRAARYIPDMSTLRRVFQANGVFVAPEDRYGLTEFLPNMFLGPSTLSRMLRLVPRLRYLFVSGIAIRSVEKGIPISMDHFLDIMNQCQGELLQNEDSIVAGPVMKRGIRGENRIFGQIFYDWAMLTHNPFEPEQVTIQYEARQEDGFIDVYTVTDRDRDLFMLSDALDKIGHTYGNWEVVRVDSKVYPDTASRHRMLIEVTNQLNKGRGFISLGVLRYEARRAKDIGQSKVAEFDRSHRNRQGEVTLSNLQDVMKNLKQRGAYMTMADMLFLYTDENRERLIARVEVFIKLKHRRLDISLVDTRLLGQMDYDLVKTLSDYMDLDRKDIALIEENGMLRDLWTAISPGIFGPLVSMRARTPRNRASTKVIAVTRKRAGAAKTATSISRNSKSGIGKTNTKTKSGS